jgi:hypothetical protein
MDIEILRQSVRQRRWLQLETLLFEHYTELEHLRQHPTQSKWLARAINACVQHTQNVDLKMALALDFGNWVAQTLERDPFVPMLLESRIGTCCICMERFDPVADTVIECHRACTAPYAHSNCYATWTRAGGLPPAKTCCGTVL